MLIIGLTGGIASGKSLVARTFKDLGAHVIDADHIVHDLLEPGQQSWQEVVDHFGHDLLTEDNSIDRRKLGQIIFSDAQERQWLNSLLHPRVFDVYTAQVKNLCCRQQNSIVIFDAALLIETGYDRHMDRLVVVYAEREQQIERLISRDKFTREQALARISSQMPLAEKREKADFVISNTGTRQETERQTREVFETIQREQSAL